MQTNDTASPKDGAHSSGPFLTRNYHTHTWRCQHATGDVDEYCRAAVQQGLTVLGMSDHAALPDNRWSAVRMAFDGLSGYCDAIDRAREDHPQLTLLKGMECEFSQEYESYYRDTLLGELGFDYLIGAAHYFPSGQDEWHNSYRDAGSLSGLQGYARYFIDSMRSGLFAFMAHPDLFGASYLTWDDNTAAASRDMLAAAAQLNVPLEINGYGLRKSEIETPSGTRKKYPWLPFWELAGDYDVTVIVNSDAHRPEDVSSSMREAAAIGERYNLRFADLSYLEQ